MKAGSASAVFSEDVRAARTSEAKTGEFEAGERGEAVADLGPARQRVRRHSVWSKLEGSRKSWRGWKRERRSRATCRLFPRKRLVRRPSGHFQANLDTYDRCVSDKLSLCFGGSTFPRPVGSRSSSLLTANDVPPPMLNEVAVHPRVLAQPCERFRVEVNHLDLDRR